MECMNYIVANVEDWDAVAKAVVPELKPGMILALSGPLGAGKTTFVQSLAKALGSKSVPRSPTFSMVRTYKTNQGEIKQLVHVDAYRIEQEEDMLPLGLDEFMLESGTVIALEWPEHVPRWLEKQALIARISIRPEAGSQVRRVSLTLGK